MPFPPDAQLICRECDPHHIMNCVGCFGFGIRPHRLSTGEVIPVTASAAKKINAVKDETGWIPCPECGSTPAGLPR